MGNLLVDAVSFLVAFGLVLAANLYQLLVFKLSRRVSHRLLNRSGCLSYSVLFGSLVKFTTKYEIRQEKRTMFRREMPALFMYRLRLFESSFSLPYMPGSAIIF